MEEYPKHLLQEELFIAKQVRLTEIDPEADAPVEAVWTHDPQYTRRFFGSPHRPLNRHQLMKSYESSSGSGEGLPARFAFAVRRNSDQSLVGFVRLPSIYWTHQTALLQMGFGNLEFEEAYGAETLQLALNYIFSELNLRRVSTFLASCDQNRADLLESAGFVRETVFRQAALADGRQWDRWTYALLVHEWHQNVER